MKEKIAVIDLGTNTFHLLIAEVHDGKMSVLHRERQAVKIGMGGINQGVIREDGIMRSIKCLQVFRKKLDHEKISNVLAFGTSALRSASNRESIISRMKSEAGIAVEVISGDQEAEYIYHGVRAAMDLGQSPSLIVDIGGGSVEFIIANQSTIFWKESLNIGAQRMLEEFHRHDPMLENELRGLMAHYESTLKPLAKEMDRYSPTTLVGSSGTFDTLSEIHCIMNNLAYVPGQSETPLSVASFAVIHNELITKDRAGRMLIRGMIEMRVDMIVVASCLIEYLLSKFSFERIRVSSYSLKEGVLAKLANK